MDKCEQLEAKPNARGEGGVYICLHILFTNDKKRWEGNIKMDLR
jgi:hypothetical protein